MCIAPCNYNNGLPRNCQNNWINLLIKFKLKHQYHVDTSLWFVMTLREITAEFIAFQSTKYIFPSRQYELIARLNSAIFFKLTICDKNLRKVHDLWIWQSNNIQVNLRLASSGENVVWKSNILRSSRTAYMLALYEEFPRWIYWRC